MSFISISDLNLTGYLTEVAFSEFLNISTDIVIWLVPTSLCVQIFPDICSLYLAAILLYYIFFTNYIAVILLAYVDKDESC